MINDGLTVSSFGSWAADEKVVGLYVTIYKVLLMNSLHSRQLGTMSMFPSLHHTRTYHLPRGHAYSLDREFPPTHIE